MAWRVFVFAAIFSALPWQVFGIHTRLVSAIKQGGGDNLWMIVFSDENDKKTDQAPGIYCADSQSRFTTPLVLGHVLPANYLSGLTQLDITQFTSRLEAWAILDGKITFFHLGSRPNNKQSFIVLGDDENPIVDQSNNTARIVSLPSITNPEDFSFLEIESDGKGQSLLFSVRNNNQMYKDQTGITFLVRLSTEKSGDTLNLTFKPTVFDYKFLSKRELANLQNPYNKNQIFSRLKANDLYSLRDDDSLFKKKWKKSANESLANGVIHSKFTPYVQTTSGEIILPEKPTEDFDLSLQKSSAKIKIESQFGESRSLITFSTNKGTSQSIYGDLNFTRLNELKSKKVISSNEIFENLLMRVYADTILVFIDNRINVIDQGVNHFLLPAPNVSDPLPNDFSFFIQKINDTFSFLLISLQYSDKAITSAYLIENTKETATMASSRHAQLTNSFFTSSELRKRSHKYFDDLLFDIKTANTNNQEDYDKAHDKTLRHISLKKKLAFRTDFLTYLEPERKIQLADNLYYYHFNEIEKVNNEYDGLYYEQSNAEPTIIQPCQILSKLDRPGVKDDVLLSEENLSLVSDKGLLSINAIAVDPNFSDGKSEYYVVFFSNKFDKKLNPSLKWTRIDACFQDFRKLKFFKAHNQGLSDLSAFAMMFSHEKNSHNGLDNFYFSIDKTLKNSENILQATTHTAPKVSSYSQIEDLSALQKRIFPGCVIDGRYFTGEIVSKKDTASGLPLLSQKLSLSGLGTIDLSIYAIDPNLNGGSKNITLLIEAKHLNDYREYYSLFVDSPLEKISNLTIIHQSSAANKNFGIIFTRQDESSSKIDTVFFQAKKISTDTVGQFLHAPYHFNTIAPYDLEKVNQHLFIDNEGHFYLARNDKDLGHRLFEVTALRNGYKIQATQSDLQLNRIKNLDDIEPMVLDKGTWKIEKSLEKQKYGKEPPRYPFPFNLGSEDLENYRNIIFDGFNQRLEEWAKADVAPKHCVLLVNPDVKEYLLKAMAGHWFLKARPNDKKYWGIQNPNLQLYYMRPLAEIQISQYSIKNNFASMSQALSRGIVPVLMADLADIVNHSKIMPGEIDNPYLISVPRDTSRGNDSLGGYLGGESKNDPDLSSDESFGDDSQELDVKTITPSIMYILANEGNQTEIEDFNKNRKNRFTTLLIGTKEEWEKTKRYVIKSAEKAKQLIPHFEEIEISEPSFQERINLLTSILSAKDKALDGIDFNLDGISISKQTSNEDKMNTFARYVIRKDQTLAEQQGESVLFAFVRLMNKFKDGLNQNLIKENGEKIVIGSAYVENMMAATYSNVPLNVKYLPDDDPLKKLSKDNAVAEWSKAGYAGSISIIKRVIDGIKAQTNSGDRKAIPASFVLFGERGSGKTYLFETLVKNFLNLQCYDFFTKDEKKNQSAQCFMVNMGNIIDRTSLSKESENMDIDTLLVHLDNFLKLPKGPRGFILFDDAHIINREVRSKLMSRIRSLFEAKNGRYRGTNIRNISLFMTMNPTSDKEKIKKFSGNEDPTLIQLAVATFNGDDNKVDESFFNRFGDIIRLDVFSTGAKGFELSKNLSESALSNFQAGKTFFTVSDKVISKIVEEYSDMNARDFLSAVRALTNLVHDKDEHSDARSRELYIIVPKRKDVANRRTYYGAENSIEHYVKNNFDVVDFKGDVWGYLSFLEMMLRNVRLNILYDLIDSLQGQNVLASYRNEVIRPTLEAIEKHIAKHPSLPLNTLNIQWGSLTETAKLKRMARINDAVAELSPEADFFPPQLLNLDSRSYDADYMLGLHSSIHGSRSRKDLIIEYRSKIEPLLKNYIKTFLFLKENQKLSKSLITAPDAPWPKQLKKETSKNLNAIATDLLKLSSDFSRDFITNFDIAEVCDLSKPCMIYDAIRIFLYTIDQSLAALPWQDYANFSIFAISTFVDERELASIQGVQDWLFNSTRTVLRPIAIADIQDRLSESLGRIGSTPETRKRNDARFLTILDHLFARGNL